MRIIRTLSLPVLLFFAVLACAPALAASTGTPMDFMLLSPGQRQNQTSMPADTASSPNQPSGQGTFFPQPPYPQAPEMNTAPVPRGFAVTPEPLYMQGSNANATRQMLGAPAWMHTARPAMATPFPPFGANLFQGFFSGTYYEGLNDNYILMPGDRVLINIWGATSYTETLMVDQQGNLFLPEVGPVRVAGLRNNQLQPTIRAHLASVFTSNIEVYANLLTAQPVAVYVTGFVQRPGRYAGGMSDSVLYYLDKAGGILADRGSFRNITVQRQNRTVTTVDLYDFILLGRIAGGRLMDGDVIVVGKRGDSVRAAGLIPQVASFEAKGKAFLGKDLIHYASPLPAASHVSITGTRNATPFNSYLKLSEFAHFPLAAMDTVEFVADKPGESIMVSVSGAVTGATHYPVTRNTTLRQLLAHVPVSPQMSNLSAIHLKRKSVAAQQKKAIEDSLRRLESSVLTVTSSNQEGAAIRVQEAALVRDFVIRVANVEPDGVVVVTRDGFTSDIMLEDGDEIVIPQHSDVVHISGEVVIPKAVVHVPGQSASRYIAEAGGLTDRGDSRNIIVAHPNGEISEAGKTKILPGDVLLVMPEYDTKTFSIFKDIMQVMYQIAISTKFLLL